MESFIVEPRRTNSCPLLCILRTVLLTVIAIFMLFLPLGDPNVLCQSGALRRSHEKAICYLCDAYYITAKAADKGKHGLSYITTVLMDILYRAKILTYKLLERVDGQDLCTTVCCFKSNDPNIEESRVRCPHCRCVRKKSSGRLKS